MTSTHSRFEDVSRRAFVKRSLLVGALVLTPGLACSKSDKQTFSGSTETTAASGSTSAPGSTAATSATPGVASTVASDSTIATSAAASFPAGGHLAVAFTFAPASSGEIHDPFIAVWIEDAKGEMVKTVSLWYKSSKSKYLNELKRWANVESAFTGTDDVDTVSSATRVAGAYTVMWDGTGSTGAPVPLGDYFVCIEAAREKGPYELIREALVIGNTASTTPLADNGELSAASAVLVV